MSLALIGGFWCCLFCCYYPPFLKYMDYQHCNSGKARRREISLLYYQDWQHFSEKGLNKTKHAPARLAPSCADTAHCSMSLGRSYQRAVLPFPVAQHLPLTSPWVWQCLQNRSVLARVVEMGIVKHKLWCYRLDLLISIMFFLLWFEPNLEAALFTRFVAMEL